MSDLKLKSSKDSNPPQLDNLQREVLGLLTEISNLIDRTQENLSNQNSEQKYADFQQQFQEAGEDIAALQLRMAIVAPMKAGKSTIINAIAGQDLLPSCAVAMTTIPTEIVFNSQLTEPILELSEDSFAVFQNIYTEIDRQIQESGIEAIQKRLARYPHLLGLLSEIKTSAGFAVVREIKGAKAISKILNRLNHLVRLSAVIDPLNNPLAQLKDIPRIQAPFLGMGNNRQGQTLGNLVIIDTPGPNEALGNLQLTSVVEEQLRRSSIILIVLDYTQLNSEAAETIKKQIEPIIDLIGKENLYVLVNKVDRRRQADMTPEQVRDFVIADLELTDMEVERAAQTKRIFEVSAIRAFAATQFLLELKQNPDAQLLEMTSVGTLAQEVFGIDWDEEIEDVTIKILAKKAEKLWKKSGFAPFLDEAISSLMGTAAPRCLMNALNLSHHRLLELRDDLSLRSQAISQDTVKLQQEVKALESDLSSLESCRTRLNEIEKIKLKLQQNLEKILTQLKQAAKVSLEDYFAEAEYDRGDVLKKADIKTRDLLLTNLGDFELFPKWVSKNLKSSLEYKTAGIAAFTTQEEAELFSRQAIIWAKQRLESLLTQLRQNTDTEIAKASLHLSEFLIQETQAIIDRAKARLETTFEIELTLPEPILYNDDELDIDGKFIKTKTRLVTMGEEARVVKKRAWYYWFGIVPFYSQEMYKKPYKKENYYTVSIHELIEKINLSTEAFIDKLQEKLITYLDEDLQQQVNIFFANLDNYLGRYLSSLQQAQSDKQLSLEEREKLVNNLDRLVPETINYLELADHYRQLTEHFFEVDNS
jgi:hypothetical protein